jgi:hypothetical protein
MNPNLLSSERISSKWTFEIDEAWSRLLFAGKSEKQNSWEQLRTD